MSLIPCPNQIGCDSDLPLTNFSSEDPDPKSFLGYSTGTAPTSSFTGGGGAGPQGGHGPDSNDTGNGVSSKSTGTGGDPPPLGSDYDNPTVTTFAESEESEDEANANAGNDNVSALSHNSKTGDPGGGYEIPPALNPPPVYSNTLQSCTVTCPDSGGFTFTVPAGAFRAFSLAQANAAARSYACRQANLNALCLGAISSTACFEQNYHQTIIASTPNIPVEFSVIAGTFPDWLTATVSDQRVDLNGTPALTDAGTVSFTIEAVDAFGFASSRSYTITVGGITTDASLPTFAKNVPYSQQFTSTDSGTYSIIAGALPTGLTLSDTGLLSGTPTVDYALFPFTAAVTNASGRCSRVFTFGNSCVPAVTPALESTLVVASGQAVFCNKTGTIFAISSTDGATLLEISVAGVVLHSFGVGADANSVKMLFYENTNQRLYVGYKVSTDAFISSVNPTTRTIISSIVVSGLQAPKQAAYDSLRNNLWSTDLAGTVYVTNCNSFSTTTIFATPNFTLNEELAYASGSDVVVAFGTYQVLPNPATLGVTIFNPGSLTFTSYDLAVPDSTTGVGYCPTNNRIYATRNPGSTLLIMNPGAPLAFTTLSLSADIYSAIYNPCINRMEVLAATSGGHLITMHYVNPATNTLVASVGTVRVLSQFNPSLLSYDSINSRVWLGTKANTLLKFT